MGDKSRIEWTDATWNPVRGCSRVSAGCANCYAERFAERWRGIPGHPFEQGFDVRLVPEALDLPLRWKRPRRVFVNSMSDLFHEAIPDDYILGVFDRMALAPRHTFQILTKRAARMRSWVTGRARAPLPPNVWLGVSVEDQRAADERIPHLLATAPAVRFLSCEPLLGPVDLRAWTLTEHGRRQIGARPGIGWIIVGGESGPAARECDEGWVRGIVEQARAAGVPTFVKQLGTWHARDYDLLHPKAADPAEWPEDLRVQEWPRGWVA